MVVINRWESLFLREYSGWILVYGRRKVGKTFILTHSLEYDLYATITYSGDCLVYDRSSVSSVSIDKCMKSVESVLSSNGVCVIDEFQRLDKKYWDILSLLHGRSKGRLVLCGSSFGIVRSVFDRNSPLLGLLLPFHIDLISPGDAVVSLLDIILEPLEAVKWSVVARDPWILGLIEPRGDPVKVLKHYSRMLVSACRGLIGEVFYDEERKLTRLYDTVLYLLAKGYCSSQTLTQKLYEKGLIENYNPGVVTGILNQLVSIGLVEKIPLWRTRGSRIYYHHRSPLLAILYSVSNIVETGLEPSLDDIVEVYSIELQFFIGELLAKYYGLVRAYTMLPKGRGDVDIVLLDRHSRRPVIGFEFKIGEISRSEAYRAIERMKSIGIPRTGLISLEEKPSYLCDECLGLEDIIAMAKKLYSIERRRVRDMVK